MEKYSHVGLNKKQICFLEKISKECKFSGGCKFSRTGILRAFLTAAKDLRINVSGIKKEQDLKKQILVAFKGNY